MNYFPEQVQIGLQEIPGEISALIPLAGCGHSCKNCHSPEYQDKDAGVLLTLDAYGSLLNEYKDKCSCITIFNGEYDPSYLSSLLFVARWQGYKTALYSGRDFDEIGEDVIKQLDYVKTGVYSQEFGGLDSPTTNQRLYQRKNENEWYDITSMFWHK